MAICYLFAPGAPEGTGCEISEHQHHARVDHEFGVVWAVRVLRAETPGPITENQNKQQEEDARNFQEDTAAHAGEGAKESADTPRDASTGTDGLLRRYARALRTNPGDGDGTGCRGGGTRDRLTCNAPGDTHADAQNPSNGLRPHPSMMLAAYWFS